MLYITHVCIVAILPRPPIVCELAIPWPWKTLRNGRWNRSSIRITWLTHGNLGFEVKRVSKSVMNILERCILKDFAYRRLCSPEVQMWFVPLRFRWVKHELTVHNVDSTCGNIWHVGQGSALFSESAQLAPLSYADHSARIFGDVQNCPDRLRTDRDVEWCWYYEVTRMQPRPHVEAGLYEQG